MTKLDILIKARKLLSDPRRWVKGSYKRENDTVDGGFCYCAIGALRAAAGCDIGYDELTPGTEICAARQALEDVIPAGSRRFVEDFNDSANTTYEDVLRLFSDAIQAEVTKDQEQVAA